MKQDYIELLKTKNDRETVIRMLLTVNEAVQNKSKQSGLFIKQNYFKMALTQIGTMWRTSIHPVLFDLVVFI